jgi:hypothetical protein
MRLQRRSFVAFDMDQPDMLGELLGHDDRGFRGMVRRPLDRP